MQPGPFRPAVSRVPARCCALPARLVGLWQGAGPGRGTVAGLAGPFDCRARAGSGHCDHDLSCRGHGRRGASDRRCLRGWSADLAREMTIQIRPLPGRNIEADLREASELARRTRGIEAVRVFSRIEAEKLLEPWLGVGLDLSELPVPRLIVLKLVPGVTPDLAALKASLAERVPNAGLDDHRLWLGRLKLMADSLVVIAS